MPTNQYIPQPPTIQGASWSPNYSGNVQMPNNANTPVNPINVSNQLAELQSQNALRGAQTASAMTDVQQKQRSMQLSMLNGVLALPQEKQQEALDNIVPMMNRMGSTQYDIKTPEQAKMLVMSQVPAQGIPEFAMNQQMIPTMQAIQQRLSGGQSAQPASGGTPMPQGTPMPPNGQLQVAPVPQGGGLPIDPATLQMMAAVPKLAPLAKDMSDIQNQSPQGQAAIEGAKNSAKNTSEAQKGAVEAGEGYQQVKQSIDSLKNLIGTTDDNGNLVPNPDLPQSKDFIPAAKWASISQNVGDQKTANAYNTFQTINESQTINAIRSLAETGQIRMTKTLENIINRGYLIDPDASPQAKLQQANAVEKELENSAIAAQNVASKMTGGQGNMPYKAPYAGRGTPMPEAGNQQFKSVEDVGAALQSGKISPVQAQFYWSQMGVK